VGDWGVILQSQDGGESWEQQPSPVSVMLNKAVFVGDQRGWIVGHDANILATRDGGKSWVIQSRDPEWGKPLYGITMLDADRGFVVGANGRMLQTSDGGANWELIEPDFTFNGTNLYGIYQLGDGSLFVHGEKGILARSTDEGQTWEQIWSPYSGSFFGAMPFGEKGAYLFGLRGTIYAIGDVSAAEVLDPMEWDEFSLETVTDADALAERGYRYYPNPVVESLFGGDSLGGNDVLLVGVNGAIVRNEGAAFQPVATAIELSLSDAVVTDKGLVAVGLGGVTRVPFQK
ncbi:MAG: WD40/YVTN/BNR-like repeat-containing protein, partial [Oceanococcaceae bacterium]